MKDINKAMSICFKNGVKIYPVLSGRHHKIQVESNGKKQPPYDKILRNFKEVNDAMTSTYFYCAEKILKMKAKFK
jgi:hypothetical protein